MPCKNCGRTFYPDRLIVHQRSCKIPLQNVRIACLKLQTFNNSKLIQFFFVFHFQKIQNTQHSDQHFVSSSSSGHMTDSSAPSTPSSIGRPPAIECYICGKLFGSKSIKIHETQCLKKWNIENESLPRDKQSPPPTRTRK